MRQQDSVDIVTVMLPKPVLTRTFVEPVSFSATYDQTASCQTVTEIPGGVQVGEFSVIFSEGFGGGLEVRAADGSAVFKIGEGDIDLNRPQGDIGLFVPDAGYPFGPIPDWLIRQRMDRPEWSQNMHRKIPPLVINKAFRKITSPLLPASEKKNCWYFDAAGCEGRGTGGVFIKMVFRN